MPRYIGYEDATDEQRRQIYNDIVELASSTSEFTWTNEQARQWSSVRAIQGPPQYLVEMRKPKPGERYFAFSGMGAEPTPYGTYIGQVPPDQLWTGGERVVIVEEP